MPKMSTFQRYSHCVADIKCCILNSRSCMANLRTDTWWCALNCSPKTSLNSYNRNATVKGMPLLSLGEWPRLEWLPFGQYLCPSPVRRIWQLYTHIPAVALVTARFMCYSKAASLGEMVSTFQTTIFLYHFHRLATNRIGCILVMHMIQWTLVYIPGYPCGVISYACKWRLCRTLQESGTEGACQPYYMDCNQKYTPAPNATHSSSSFMLFRYLYLE